MSFGEVAALIAAIAFAMLVLILTLPILRLRHTVDAATRMINDLNDRTAPLLGDVNTTVKNGAGTEYPTGFTRGSVSFE